MKIYPVVIVLSIFILLNCKKKLAVPPRDKNLLKWSMNEINSRLDTVKNLDHRLKNGTIERDMTVDDEIFTVDVILTFCSYQGLNIEFRNNKLYLQCVEFPEMPNCNSKPTLYRLKYMVINTAKIDSVIFERKSIQ